MLEAPNMKHQFLSFIPPPPPHHSFFFSSMETPPGPRATTSNRPPITDVVWKKSYLRKSCMGLYDGMFQKALKVKLMQSSHTTRVSAASFVLKPTATSTMSAEPTRFCRIWTQTGTGQHSEDSERTG